MVVRPYCPADVEAMRSIWNDVVDEGQAFPQTDCLSFPEAEAFFASQSRCAVALEDDDVVGFYLLHPNNVGRAGHIANASYAVKSGMRHHGIGRALVMDSLASLASLGFTGLQFNAVVASNQSAIHLYEDLGFRHIGTIPKGFRPKDKEAEDIHIYYHEALI